MRSAIPSNYFHQPNTIARKLVLANVKMTFFFYQIVFIENNNKQYNSILLVVDALCNCNYSLFIKINLYLCSLLRRYQLVSQQPCRRYQNFPIAIICHLKSFTTATSIMMISSSSSSAWWVLIFAATIFLIVSGDNNHSYKKYKKSIEDNHIHNDKDRSSNKVRRNDNKPPPMSNEVPVETYDPEFRKLIRPFRMAKINVIWSKAQQVCTAFLLMTIIF